MSSSSSGRSPKLVLFTVVFIDLLGFGIMIPMLPFYVRHFGENAFRAAALMSIYSLMQMIVSPFWGQLSDRMGRRPVLLATIAGQCIATFLGGLSFNFIALFLTRFLAGIFAGNISTANAYMADITDEKDRAKGMGIIGAAFGLGFIFGPAIGGLLLPYGYQWPFFVAGGLSLINLVWAIRSLPEPIQDLEERKKRRRRIQFDLIPKIFSNAQLATPIVLFFLSTMAFTQIEVTFGYFVTERFGVTERMSGLFLAGMGLVMAIVQGGLIGKIAKAMGEVGSVRLGLALIAYGLLAIVFLNQVGWFLAGLFVLAVGYSLNNPCLSAWASKAAPAEDQGGVLGIYQSGASLARILGPLLGGYLYTRTKAGAFMSALVIILIAKIIVAIYSRRLALRSPEET